VHHGVEAALPSRREEAEGFHPRPADPIDAFAFVGTRYAARTTEGMIEALRRDGFDDVAILDLAIAVADANQWARTHRLLGLEAGLFSLAEEIGTD
jgi:alkylhydroperoxidase family enzyme